MTGRGGLLGVDVGTASTKGGHWTRTVSDVTVRPQYLPEQTVGVAFEPDGQNRALYDLYGELHPAIGKQSHRLSDRQKGAGDVVT